MYLLGLGIILMVMKYLEFGPVASWSWLWVLSPLVAAIVWWSWADSSGYTKRKAMEREDKRRQERLDRTKAAIGTNYKKRR